MINTFNERSIILDVDAYKVSHKHQYPPGTTNVRSYIEARKGSDPATLFFGLKMWLDNLKPITKEDIDMGEIFWKQVGLPFDRRDWEYILDNYEGHLPLVIKAVPEGSLIPLGNPLVVVVNTDPKCFWLTSYIETSLLRSVWYPTTVATNSWNIREIIAEAILETDGEETLSELLWKLHDFAARGVSSFESAEIGGAAHLVNFMGTDTASAIIKVVKHYGGVYGDIGNSIPASEHSTITTWGKSKETQAYENMLDKFGGVGKIVACVSDSYDIWNAVDNIWAKPLRDRVINSGGCLGVRPDSGNPVTVPVDVAEKLMDSFGNVNSSKNFRVLPSYLRVVQGDGLSRAKIKAILQYAKSRKIAASNFVFGLGGGLLQKVDRDTYSFAMKSCEAKAGGVWRDVYKNPGDDPSKASKRGNVTTVKDAEGRYHTAKVSDMFKDPKNPDFPVMENVYFDGLKYPCNTPPTFSDIRARALKSSDFASGVSFPKSV